MTKSPKATKIKIAKGFKLKQGKQSLVFVGGLPAQQPGQKPVSKKKG